MLTRTHSPARAAVAMAAFVFAVVSGCGDESTRGSSNPNWLQSCNSDAVCGKGLSCLCGICTLECRTQANCATLGRSATCLSNATLSSACMVNGLCLRFATLPDGSLTTGGSSGRGNGGRGTGGAGPGGRSNGGASTGGASTGGASTGGTSTGGSDGGSGSGGKAATGGASDASAGDLDAGPPPDARRDASRAEGGTPSCEGKICRCASGAYCLDDAAQCIEPHAACPAERRVVACDPSCGAGTVCVRRQTIGGALFTPDAGRCEEPRLIVPEAPFACSLPPSFACEPAPTACTGTATCACAGTLCTTGNECVENVAGQIDCIARAP
jgi:hypothetical protein